MAVLAINGGKRTFEEWQSLLEINRYRDKLETLALVAMELKAGTPEQKAILVFRFENTDAAIQALQEKGVNVVGSLDLFNRIE